MSPRKKRDPLDEEIGSLYALPLEEFIGGRNALAARLKKEGDAGASARVKALSKPTPSAWAVNQLFQRERERMDELLDAGEQARSALHEAITSGGAESLREAIQESRRLIEDLRQRALEFLAEGGRPATAAMADRIGTNLQSLTFTPAAAEAAQRGWLETDLDPPGFEVLAGLQIAAGAGGARPQAARPVKEAPPIRRHPAPATPAIPAKPERTEKKKKAPEPARREPEKAKALTKQEREEARLKEWREREEARQRAQQEREEARLRERLEAAEEEAERTAAEARDLQEEADKAARAAAEARRAAEKAQDRAGKASEALAHAREALSEAQKGAKILSHPGARSRGKS